ncbi:MAG: dipeptide ABC transporter ATP-binding protein [Deltaproteobacteria bacterium]|nr:dipeptide ABC transporter ATP-binding protein [Deltaproteobacteria bacterium]
MAPLLDLRDLKVYFPVSRGVIFRRHVGIVRAVDGVSFAIAPGETLGLVGESGCGKSTVARAILRLVSPTAGEILWDGEDLARAPAAVMRRRRRDLQMIFQDPYASLNPRMTVGDIVAEPLKTFRLAQGKALKEEVQRLMHLVGLNPRYIRRYPHEFSGGQRQRIGIARALALRPRLIVADEPVSALDVSIQAQILNLLMDLRQQFGLTYLFISHDLAVVRHVSNRIAVMYLGKIMEIAEADEIMAQPLHPYTQVLLSAVPIPDPVAERERRRIVAKGDLPSPLNPPAGCPFHTRCPFVMPHCKTTEPPLKEYNAAHLVACHLMELPREQLPSAYVDVRVTPAHV